MPSDCAIPNCGAARGAFTLAPPNCPTQQPATSNNCHKVKRKLIMFLRHKRLLNPSSTQEEYSCLDGNCISKDYVCDGEPDCGGGEDERDCRRIASLFAKEEGFRLQGGGIEKKCKLVKPSWRPAICAKELSLKTFLSRRDRPNSRGDV